MRSRCGFLIVMAAASLVGCGGFRTPPTQADRPHPAAGEATASSASAVSTPPGAPPAPATSRHATVRTRHATFKPVSYEDLAGWRDDDVSEAWGALRRSCEALNKRPYWKDICADAQASPVDAQAARGFFESRFTPLRVLGPRGETQGDVTGYYEPLLEGRTQRDGAFNVPVMGLPRDLFTFDWKQVPAAQRRTVLRVKPVGNRLVQASAIESSTFALDLRRFTLDDRDRRLRVALAGQGVQARAQPYYTRAELTARGLPQGLDAPVVAWTNDPLSLYAMQVQGSGRMRTEGGKLVRLQYAEQNGHPFKPLALVAKNQPRLVTRGAASVESAESFAFEPHRSEGVELDSTIVTRGRPMSSTTPPSPASATTDAVVAALLQSARAAPARTPTTSTLDGDPSYVFFRAAPDRAIGEGPEGALGVPLTPGRSIAVDPRVTPLGYPVFINPRATKPTAAAPPRRLVFAQDTGGAIRGAARIDYFWGFGRQAGQSARTTKWRTEMWVLVPNEEARQLNASRKLVTRGGKPSPADADTPPSCLLADGEFCAESAD